MAALECQTCHRDPISHWKIINAVVTPLYSAILGKENPKVRPGLTALVLPSLQILP